jgi:hypothetical protein
MRMSGHAAPKHPLAPAGHQTARPALVAIVLLTGLALTGCASAASSAAGSVTPAASASATAVPAPAQSTTAAPSPTPAPSVTPAPSPLADEPAAGPAAGASTADSPIDALAAWAVCKGFGDGGNQSVHPITNLYAPENIVESDGAFTVQLIGAVGARSDTDSWCEISGTFGEPQATFHLIAAEPTSAPTAPFAAIAPAAGERTEGTPVDSLTAWTMCKGFERGLALDLESETGTATNRYGPQFIVESDAGFTVYLLGTADSAEPTATCTISGPLGDPAAEFLLPR